MPSHVHISTWLKISVELYIVSSAPITHIYLTILHRFKNYFHVSFTTTNALSQPQRTGTTGAGRTSCCAQTAAFTSRSTVSCPPLRSQWTHRHLCSNLSKRKRMDSAGSIAWGLDGTEDLYVNGHHLPISMSGTLSWLTPSKTHNHAINYKLVICKQVILGQSC